MTVWAAAGLAFGLAVVGYAAKWLTTDGAVAAGAVGAAVLAGAGLTGALLLGSFFVSGSVLSAVNAKRFGEPGGARRNARQVLANGTWAAIGALLVRAGSPAGWVVLVGGLAAAQSDTWATEIGRRSGRPPRLITTWRPVATGTSGGVTGLGTGGGLAGAVAVGGLAWLAGVATDTAVAGAGAGVIGMLVDSLLGATLQGRFRCQACGEVTERRVHRSGHHGVLLQGWQWLDNDVVNFLACATGAGVGAAWLAASRF